ncbi:MAG: hypothetical protein IJT94_09155, partial [Oscillibacter sp.]|nr:hypothetical protein [Oscillibacter sp.]
LHLGKVALYQMSYARKSNCSIPDFSPFVKACSKIFWIFFDRRREKLRAQMDCHMFLVHALTVNACYGIIPGMKNRLLFQWISE